ncbi:acyltransferase [Massilia sp. CF038]|uniref:acyltransferase family protein n=1 Tax=Massilia sp. CF038 TaxID=1881045 RepID=UPI00091B0ECB|nr:acyltransferase family protein [Massilia sp. CF038]SHH02659.1 Peptidoglycan/LPS O-acetylase OafA/YrhL, contains acyltransferase and SGNH-hydrolase domains [Massilia sp. CF038]
MALQVPRLRVMPHSQLSEDSYHSLLISLLRGMAALQVAAAHLRAEFMPGLRGMEQPALWYQALAFATGFAHQAVLVFFLISGWLVGGSLLNKRAQADAVKLYAIDRLTRLWTVLLPTFLLILAFGILTGKIDPRQVDFARENAYSVTALAGNLLALQTISVPQFGGNYPLWSLANEAWYYLLFPLLLACAGGKYRGWAALALALAAVLLPLQISLYFSIWLLGAACSRLRLVCGAGTRLVLLLLTLVLSVHFRLTGRNDGLELDSFVQDLTLSVPFMLLLCSTVVKPSGAVRLAPARRVADFFSNFSFTLYVVHIPVLGLLAWLGDTLIGRSRMDASHPVQLLVFAALLAVVVLFSYGFYCLFEARTHQVRRWLKQALLAPQPGLRAM